MNKDEFDGFFKPYAQSVDKAESIAFWKLSDKIIEAVISKHVGDSLGSDDLILDAGGGTGRWACNLSKQLGVDFVVYDLSEDMLKRAKENIEKKGMSDQVSIVNGDLEDMSEIESNSISHIVSIYSPISFVNNTEKAFSELYRILKPGGKIIIMGHSYFNALDSMINNYDVKGAEISCLEETMMVKWGDHVPLLKTFSKETMEEYLEKAGFKIETTHGIPIFARPNGEDWDQSNEAVGAISKKLSDENYLNSLFDLEMKYNNQESLVNRGMNIMSVGKK